MRPFEFANLQYLRSKTRVRQVHQGQWAGGYELKAKGSIDLTSPSEKPCDFAVACDASSSSVCATPTACSRQKPLPLASAAGSRIGPHQSPWTRTAMGSPKT